MSKLFSTLNIGQNLELANRIVIPPMCQYSAANGQATDWHLMHYGNLALSGAGMLIFEATAVSPEGRISYADLGLWDKNTASALKRIVDFIRLHSQIPLILQIGHAGRKGSTIFPWEGFGYYPVDSANGWQTVSASAIPQKEGGTVPKALASCEIETIVQQFARTAKLAEDIGFDGVEIHAAHGYLIHQFLSPITNKRIDEYGGRLTNRMKFGLAIYDAIKSAVSANFIVGTRISATDWIEGGWNLKDSIVFSKALDLRGCSYIHVSAGGLDGVLQKLPDLVPGYQLPYAEAIKREVKMPVIGVGLITKPEEAVKALSEEKADLIAIGRNMIYNPRWGWHAAAALGEQIIVPSQYKRCQPHQYKNLFK